MSSETTGLVAGWSGAEDRGTIPRDRYFTARERNEQARKLNIQLSVQGWEGHTRRERGEDSGWEGSEGNSEGGWEGEESGDQDGVRHANNGVASEELIQKLGEIEFALANAKFVRELDTCRETQSRFLRDYGRYIGEQPPPKTDNVLHFMAGKRSVSVWLLRYMLEHHKARMDGIDNAGRRPLTLAIEEKKELFIETVLESSYDAKDLQRILRMSASSMGNGIHAAINAGLSPRLTVALINKVSDDVLCQKDGAGCTPLHRAVEYERCREGQIEVVRALLDCGDLALDEKTNENLSVYQHHFSTRPADENTNTAGIAGNSQLSQRNGAKKEVADMIAEEVKLWYLRSTLEDRGGSKTQRSHDSAVDFLYGDGQSECRVLDSHLKVYLLT
jgi:hypothetical protein